MISSLSIFPNRHQDFTACLGPETDTPLMSTEMGLESHPWDLRDSQMLSQIPHRSACWRLYLLCVSSKSGPEKEEAKHTSVMMYVHSDERCLLDTDDV